MSIINSIINNRNNGYNQGVFANELTRNDLYSKAELITSNNNDPNFNYYVKDFLISTLMWGNFNVVVGRYKRVDAQSVINSIPDFNNYARFFEQNLNNQNLSINQKYSLFLRQNGLYIRTVGFAYFTKFLHFYSFGNRQNSLMLILDKWALYAWCALIIEMNLRNEFYLLPKLIRPKNLSAKNISGELYNEYNLSIKRISIQHGIPFNSFEELMFGWDRRNQNINMQTGYIYENPRIEILNTLNNNINLFRF